MVNIDCWTHRSCIQNARHSLLGNWSMITTVFVSNSPTGSYRSWGKIPAVAPECFGLVWWKLIRGHVIHFEPRNPRCTNEPVPKFMEWWCIRPRSLALDAFKRSEVHKLYQFFASAKTPGSEWDYRICIQTCLGGEYKYSSNPKRGPSTVLLHAAVSDTPVL